VRHPRAQTSVPPFLAVLLVLLLGTACTGPGGGGDGDGGDGYADARDGDGWDGAGGEGGGELDDAGPDRADQDPWADWDDPYCRAWLDLYDEELRRALHTEVEGHDGLSYDRAREEMFSFVDNEDGQVQGVYTGEWVSTSGIPDANIMNTEHTWCQSWGADSLPAKSDLNHLFPTISSANSVRSNYPFGWVLDATWSQGGSSKGLDGWGQVVFEPRDAHKGDAARAIFYFAIRYQMPVPDGMEEVLRQWNRLDPPDDKERTRAERIEQLQNRRNPLVFCPLLVEQIADF